MAGSTLHMTSLVGALDSFSSAASSTISAAAVSSGGSGLSGGGSVGGWAWRRRRVVVAMVTAKKMFGGYGIFESGAMFALLSGRTVYFKVDDTNRAQYEAMDNGRFGLMLYRVSEAALEMSRVCTGWWRSRWRGPGRRSKSRRASV
ncbi:MAG TPA: TfoX/Sxy family protein [Chloroflexota bacterium]|nr:TfoX/Sxy family protein [Chloroflexota bacterium]